MRPLIALDQLELHAEQNRQEFGIDRRIGARSRAANRQFPGVEILQRLHRRILARRTDRRVRARTPDIVALARIKLRGLPAQMWLNWTTAIDHPDHAAIP